VGRTLRSWAVFCLFVPGLAHGESGVDYALRYVRSSHTVAVSLTLSDSVAAPAALVMPRTYPGGYEQLPYDAYVTQVIAHAPDGSSLPISKDADGPRWTLGRAGDSIRVIEYVVDVARMEADIRSAVSSSKIRKGYVGLLGYSVFAYVEGLQDRAVRLRVNGPNGWPVLATLNPKIPPSTTGTVVSAANYDELADSQVMMGPDLRVTRLAGAIPLVMAVYAERNINEVLESHLAREALDRVQQYFGDTPMPQYTMQLEFLRPRPGHQYLFSQEHAKSGSFSFALDAPLTPRSSAAERDRVLFNFAHHMAHCWVPVRVYGAGYRPIVWEMTPVIDTIWFNEGFGRYAALAALVEGMSAEDAKSYREVYLKGRAQILNAAPSFIRRMSLEVLSREASFLYSEDFRTGANIAARGLMMAAEMDDRIREETHGQKSLRDAFRWLLAWSAEHRTAFLTDRFPAYIESATGVAVADIFARWQQPPDH
jgi:predicted metalloprotease with PDZ domain